MQFLFYASKDAQKLNQLAHNIPTGYTTIQKSGYILIYKLADVALNDEEITATKGFVHHTDNDRPVDLPSIIRERQWPIYNVSGQFCLMQYKPEQYLHLATDTIGMYPMYYYINGTDIVVATLPALFKNAGISQIDYTGIISKMLPLEYQTWGRRTVLKNVRLIMPGEFIHYDIASGKTSCQYDTTIVQENTVKSPKLIAEEYTAIMEAEAQKTLGKYEDVYLGLSGGVDSRTLLAMLQGLKNRMHCVSYGRDNYIDVSIARRIADKLGHSFGSYDPIPYLFPEKDMAFKYAVDTDSVYITPWLAITEGLKDKVTGHPPFLVGDICDYFRAKNITRFKGRDFRVNATLKKVFLGKELKLTPFNGDLGFLENNIFRLLQQRMPKFEEFLAGVGISTAHVMQELQHDIHEDHAHVKRYNIEYEENFEELAGVFHHGRLGMGTQVRILEGSFRPVSLMSNMASVRYILNINPLSRLADKVTHTMFRMKKYKALGDIPTAQAPFVSYNSNFYTVMFFWALRSKMDAYMTKQTIKKQKATKARVFDNLNYFEGYAEPANEQRLRSYFEQYPMLMDYPLKVFTNRRNMKSMPLANTDLTAYIQAMAYMQYFNS